MKLKYYSGAQVTSILEKLPSKEYLEMLNAFAKEPSADVVERKKGKWEIVYDEDCDDGGKYICGNCRHAFSFGAYFELCRFDYCPNCGAIMDERKDND